MVHVGSNHNAIPHAASPASVTAAVNAAVTDLVNGAPANADTFKEVSDSLTVKARASDLLKALASSPDQIATGTITRSANGAATGFAVAWPDGATGTFTGTESTSTPGAIDSYTVTHVLAGTTVTYTQPALTRDSTGAVTNRPNLVVT